MITQGGHNRFLQAVLLSLIILGICSSPASGQSSFKTVPPVILVSIDGFRYDYLEHTHCPNLRDLAASGTRAEWMIPVFPTKTFPNHYTIVTGLYPENHGIVSNTMYDPEFNEMFGLWKREEVTNGRWWGGEPIWVTAEKQGLKSATYFWPGSEAVIAGERPSSWKVYDGSVPYDVRVKQVLDWLDYPGEERPSLVTLYFEGVDHAGHDYGPDFTAMDTSVAEADRALGMLVEGLTMRGILDSVNMIVVSDHGMAPVEKSRTVWLDDYINTDSVRVVDWGIVVSLWPRVDMVENVYSKVLEAHPQMKAYRKGEVPERLHYRNNRRIAPIILIADEGWTITRRGSGNAWRRSERGGNHGYDNQSVTMRALLVARGPAFKPGAVVEPIENIHLYSLMAHLLKLKPAANDGNLEAVRSLLR